ncbi:hypothetical protein EXIGLDRAFT_704090 [Exidia glandulosa HHB12029]|uniref:Uncharacterized protein n=1 Tax=Exidia glandulosa HHB12029 TaxID=1314781 RepID=A0A165BTS6_EXIGL|nr:hypothetical protein EXIGLDRAFT_704090 [Exidia glandulosa HHB12029]
MNFASLGTTPGQLTLNELLAMPAEMRQQLLAADPSTLMPNGPIANGAAQGPLVPQTGHGTPSAETAALQAELAHLKAEVESLKQQVPGTENAVGKTSKPRRVPAWYDKNKTPGEAKAAKRLGELALKILRELINVEDVHGTLPHRGHQFPRTLADGEIILGFHVDLVKSPTDSYNAALVNRAIELVEERVKRSVEGFEQIVGCPTIGNDAARWAVKKQFGNLKKTFKEQNDAAAAAKKVVRDHNLRAHSTKKNKCARREVAIDDFIKLYDRDPTTLVQPDWMSADESAHGDADKMTAWWDHLKQPTHMRTKANKPLATQTLLWRAPLHPLTSKKWLTWILHELDRIAAERPDASVRASYPRIPAALDSPGPLVMDPPPKIPPINIVDPSWIATQESMEKPAIIIEQWRNAVATSLEWGSYEEESALWPPALV